MFHTLSEQEHLANLPKCSSKALQQYPFHSLQKSPEREQQLLSEKMWHNYLPTKCDSNLACSDKLIFILQGEKFKEVMKRGPTSSPLQTCVIANISVILSHLCSIHSPSKSIWQIFQNAHPRLFNNNHFILCNKVLKEYLAVS